MFDIITDSASNLTEDLARKYNINIITYKCNIAGEEYLCYEDGRDDEVDGKEFYDKLRNGADIKTSLISPGDIIGQFIKSLNKDNDILFLCMSQRLSGTYQSAQVVKSQLEEDYPDRKIVIVDSMSASFGEGFLAIQASLMREKGASLHEAAKWIEDNRLKMRHIFTVEDLKYLLKGGRVSHVKALLSSMLSIKPLLYASNEARIERFSVVRGRKKSLDYLVEDYLKYAVNPSEQIIAIAHCDCKEEAEYIADRIRKENPTKEIIIKVYDRCSGAHVGPGGVCIFFMGNNRLFN